MLSRIDKFFEKKVYAFAAIAAMTLVAYCGSFSVPFILDDYGSIVNNYSIRNPLNLLSMWKFYSNRFIVYITFSINWFIHDNGVEGYHITNTLLHIFNGFLVFLIFRYILSLKPFEGKQTGRYRNLIALMGALIFVVHPMQVNAVTYIVQRIASLAAMFYLLAVLFFLRFRIYDKWNCDCIFLGKHGKERKQQC